MERRTEGRAERRFREDDEEAPPRLQVSVADVMERDVLMVPEETSLESVSWALLARGLSGAPVVDREGRLAGFVSMTDLVREQFDQGETAESVWPRSGRAEDRLEELRDGFFPTKLARASAREVMSEDVVALSASASLRRAVVVMVAHGLDRVAVVAADRRVVGVVSTIDVLRWFARHEGPVVS